MPKKGNVRELLKKTAGAPSLEELLTHVTAELGGVVALARLIATEINTAKANSLARTRLLETVVRGFKSNDLNKQGPRDYALMSDEDLDRLMLDSVTRLRARAEAEEELRAEEERTQPQGVEHPGQPGGQPGEAGGQQEEPPAAEAEAP